MLLQVPVARHITNTILTRLETGRNRDAEIQCSSCTDSYLKLRTLRTPTPSSKHTMAASAVLLELWCVWEPLHQLQGGRLMR